MTVHSYPPAMRRLVNELTKLPSIGEKSAARLAYHLLINSNGDALTLASALQEAKETTRFCHVCFSLTDQESCKVCQDENRFRSIICVVEKPADVIALERMSHFRGIYHVLHGLWSPLRGVEPEKTKIKELISRVRKAKENTDFLFPPVEELLLATSTTVEGDATALYIANSVSEFGIKVTRIAQGLPKGGELEYADEMTLSHAIEGRRSL